MNKQVSVQSVASKFHTEMTDEQLARHQSAEDEAKLKFQEEIRKEQKQKQFRQKYLLHDVYLHKCNECKSYGMMLRLETCVLCGA